MGSARRFRRANRNAGQASVTVTTAWRGSKPAIVTHAEFSDVTPYGAEILDALKAGYEAGLEYAAALVIHRMSDYAKRLGLTRHPEPFIIQAISWEKAVDLCPVLGPIGKSVLPTVDVILATSDRLEPNVAVYPTPDGAVLAWRFSAEGRERIRQTCPDAVETLVKLTGVQ